MDERIADDFYGVGVGAGECGRGASAAGDGAREAAYGCTRDQAAAATAEWKSRGAGREHRADNFPRRGRSLVRGQFPSIHSVAGSGSRERVTVVSHHG